MPRLTHSLVVHDGGAVSSHGLLLDDTDELEGAAERSVGVGPLGALEMSHLQHVVVLSHTAEDVTLTHMTGTHCVMLVI